MSRIEHDQIGRTDPAAKPFSWRQALLGGLASLGLIAAVACGGASDSGDATRSPAPTTGAVTATNTPDAAALATRTTIATPTRVLAPTRFPSPSPTPFTGGGSSSVPTPTPGASSGSQAKASQIQGFVLESFTISAGTTVTWTNLDSAAHTSTSGISPNFDGAFDSSAISQNGTFSHRFNSSGAFPYFCSIHPSMTGTITVQ